MPLRQQRAPEVLLRSEKRMLQVAVDALLDNGWWGSSSAEASDHPLHSLSDRLKGKRGRFRDSLLGKRGLRRPLGDRGRA